MPRHIENTLFNYIKQHPELQHLIAEYSDKNEIPITEISCKDTSKGIKWYCKKCDHEWEERVYNRIRYPSTPCCMHKHPTKYYNLATEFPQIAIDFDESKNNGKKVTDYLPFSHEKVWWKCHTCGHEWQTVVTARCGKRPSRCPNCVQAHTSKAERILYAYFKEHFPLTKKTKINNVEYDVFIPELNLAIEYDGYPWHTAKKDMHIKKLNIARQNGFTLLNIAECKNTPEVMQEVRNQYTPEHNVMYFPVDYNYNLEPLLPQLIVYLENMGGIKLPAPRLDVVQSIIKDTKMVEIPDSLWNSEDIPWIRNWIAPQDIQKAKVMKAGTSQTITIRCPNCGREWDTPVHWIKKQFRGCTKRSGGCGYQGQMGNQLSKV